MEVERRVSVVNDNCKSDNFATQLGYEELNCRSLRRQFEESRKIIAVVPQRAAMVSDGRFIDTVNQRAKRCLIRLPNDDIRLSGFSKIPAQIFRNSH